MPAVTNIQVDIIKYQIVGIGNHNLLEITNCWKGSSKMGGPGVLWGRLCRGRGWWEVEEVVERELA